MTSALMSIEIAFSMVVQTLIEQAPFSVFQLQFRLYFPASTHRIHEPTSWRNRAAISAGSYGLETNDARSGNSSAVK